ncbi:hypothetical protein KOR34_00830 [Posidoniimonas corsicana]|uniref:Uncharacterized protein n=1 Tax=Posidoniimonas corsicana TaxID=1938618 RepID=A0A5C5VC33_9BACT|nr:hypothetical protein KOR34_00830 [Posidoniimonas corsicana]
MNLEAWKPHERMPLTEIRGCFESSLGVRFKRGVGDISRCSPILDEFGHSARFDGNWSFAQGGACIDLANRVDTLSQFFKRQCDLLMGEAPGVSSCRESTWCAQHIALSHLVGDFFGRCAQGFGWWTIVFARLPKALREHEDPCTAHTFQCDKTALYAVRLRSDGSYWPACGVRVPISAFEWKVPNATRPTAQYMLACHTISLRHAELELGCPDYNEDRIAFADGAAERALLAKGKIPAIERDPRLRTPSHGAIASLLISFSRIVVGRIGIPMARNLTLEFDPYTLELISIRTYEESVDRYTAIASAFDHWHLSKTIGRFF